MSFSLPKYCPHCNSTLTFDGIHLMCENSKCSGKISKILSYGVGVLDLKGIGGKTIEPFAKDFDNIIEIMLWVLFSNDKPKFSLEPYGIQDKSRSAEIFIDAFKNIRSLPYDKVIAALGYDGVGKKLSQQLAKQYCGIDADYSGLEKELVTKMLSIETMSYIKDLVKLLEKFVTIDKPTNNVNANSIYVCLTGKTTDYGFKTKEEFLKSNPNLIETSLSDKKCQFLITDSYSSTSGKMKTAKSKNIRIITYGDFVKN